MHVYKHVRKKWKKFDMYAYTMSVGRHISDIYTNVHFKQNIFDLTIFFLRALIHFLIKIQSLYSKK